MSLDTHLKSKISNVATVAQEICGRRSPCRLHLLHCGQVIKANFRNCRGTLIDICIENAQKAYDLQADAMCCVVFPYRQCLCAFLGSIRNLQAAGSDIQVSFEIPQSLMITNLRRSFRVPITNSTGVTLQVRLGDGTLVESTATNISESGLEIRISQDETRLPAGSVVQLEIEFREENLQIPAVVKRQSQTFRALQFALATLPEARKQTAILQRMVRSIEQCWLKSRADSAT